jgi:hypothetical protein
MPLNLKQLVKECVLEVLMENLTEGFDPQSQGPNIPEENPYPQWNSQMRTLEEEEDDDLKKVEKSEVSDEERISNYVKKYWGNITFHRKNEKDGVIYYEFPNITFAKKDGNWYQLTSNGWQLFEMPDELFQFPIYRRKKLSATNLTLKKDLGNRVNRKFNGKLELSDLDYYLNQLSERERIIFKLRANGSTFDEIGEKFRITTSRARQIYINSLNKIREIIWRDDNKIS